MAAGRIRAAVLIVREGAIALIERRRGGRRYYLFPGGGVEEGEVPERAAEREAFEELGLTVRSERLVAEVTHGGSRQLYFLASIIDGCFGSGRAAELSSPEDSEDGTYTPVWLPLDRLSEGGVQPARVAELVRSSAAMSWPVVPLRYDDPGPP